MERVAPNAFGRERVEVNALHQKGRLLLRRCAFLFWFIGLAFLCAGPAYARTVIRVGYFPNLTHAQAVIGALGTHEGNGWFEPRLGDDVELRWRAFNAGPAAMEALLREELDLLYVGPVPALRAYVRVRASEVRLLAGSAEGGAALVVRDGAGISSAADLRGKRIATPQAGNTQDVAARAFLRRNAIRLSKARPETFVTPLPNRELLARFRAGTLDAAWTVEPWVSQLEREAGARLLHEPILSPVTVLVGRAAWLRDNADFALRFRDAHAALTGWINANPAAARERVWAGLDREVKSEVSRTVVAAAWPRLKFTTEITRLQINTIVRDARSVGELKQRIYFDRLFMDQPGQARSVEKTR